MKILKWHPPSMKILGLHVLCHMIIQDLRDAAHHL